MQNNPAWLSDGYPHIWLPLPEPWRAGQYAATLRQAGVLVRTMDHFAVGRSPAPHAVRISLNAVASLEQLRSGLQTVAAVLKHPPAAVMDPGCHGQPERPSGKFRPCHGNDALLPAEPPRLVLGYTETRVKRFMAPRSRDVGSSSCKGPDHG